MHAHTHTHTHCPHLQVVKMVLQHQNGVLHGQLAADEIERNFLRRRVLAGPRSTVISHDPDVVDARFFKDLLNHVASLAYHFAWSCRAGREREGGWREGGGLCVCACVSGMCLQGNPYIPES